MGPALVTLLLLEAPTIALAAHIIALDLLSPFLAGFLLLLALCTTVSMFKCCYTDPGIIPQNVNNY